MATHRHTPRATEFAYTFVGEPHVCAYCGDLADTEDHTVPAWYAASNLDIVLYCKLYKVAACRDCNGRAGSKVDRSFLHRKRRIAKSLRKRFRGLLIVADWPDDELDELGYRLRVYVEAGAHARAHLMARLHMLDSGLFPPGMPAFFFSGLHRQRLKEAL